MCVKYIPVMIYDNGSCQLPGYRHQLPQKYEILAQWCFNSEPASQTAGQP